MYDSLLLQREPERRPVKKLKKKSTLEGSSSKVNIQIPGKTFDAATKTTPLKPINPNSLSPRAKYISSINFEDHEERSEMESSSA
jgi:hypothetical protein